MARALVPGGGAGLVTTLASVLVDGDGPTIDEGSDGTATAVAAPVERIVDELVAGAHATRANVSAADAATAPPGRAYFAVRIEGWRMTLRG
jgi:hypothetical protein